MNWRAIVKTVAGLGLHPLDFWGEPDRWFTGMTLDELVTFSEGVADQREWARTLAGWHAANVVNLGGMRKNAVKLEKILGRPTEAPPMTMEEMRARLARDREKAEASSSVHFDDDPDRELSFGADDDDAIDYGRGYDDDDEDEDAGEWQP